MPYITRNYVMFCIQVMTSLEAKLWYHVRMRHAVVILFVFVWSFLGCSTPSSQPLSQSEPVTLESFYDGSQYRHELPQLDYSAYQVPWRWWYHQLFSSDCRACHTASRPINAPHITKSQWRHIMIEMRRNKVDYDSEASK